MLLQGESRAPKIVVDIFLFLAAQNRSRQRQFSIFQYQVGSLKRSVL